MTSMRYALALAMVVVLLLPSMLEYIVTPRFKVHGKGGVVVTGASSGIGLHAAVGLAKMGFTVFAGVRKERDAERLRTAHTDLPNLLPIILDVTNPQHLIEASELVRHTLDSSVPPLPLVALVNNAGVQADMPLELQDPANDRSTFDVNVFGVLDTTRAFVAQLRATGDGARVVNVGSLAGLVGSPGSVTYTASKFALEGISDSLRMELQGFGISVSLLQPGYVVSKMADKAHVASAELYGLTQEQYDQYRVVFEGFFANDKYMGSPKMASPPSVTTNAIVHAITSPRPRTRYPVANVGGLPAWVVSRLKQVLSDRLMDVLALDPGITLVMDTGK